MKCRICGKEAIDLVEICPDCLTVATVPQGHIRKLRQVSDILSITANQDLNIQRCMDSIIEIANDLEGKSGKKEEKGAAVPEE